MKPSAHVQTLQSGKAYGNEVSDGEVVWIYIPIPFCCKGKIAWRFYFVTKFTASIFMPFHFGGKPARIRLACFFDIPEIQRLQDPMPMQTLSQLHNISIPEDLV
jgi:hypothetical protein